MHTFEQAPSLGGRLAFCGPEWQAARATARGGQDLK